MESTASQSVLLYNDKELPALDHVKLSKHKSIRKSLEADGKSLIG